MDTSHPLMELSTVSVDTDLPKEQRIIEYVRQVKDPYHFIAGGIKVTAEFDPNGPPFEECLRGLMA